MTAGDSVIEVLTSSDIPRAAALLVDVFRETDAQKLPLMDEAFYRWQYEETESPVVIAKLGGEEAIAETFRAIQDVGRWWP